MSPDILQQISSIISTIGFPIVCVIFMWRKITDSDEKYQQLLSELTIAIKELTIFIKEGEKK